MSGVILSIVIPTLNEADGIIGTLLPLQTLRQQHCEIIVSDGGSDDDTLEHACPLVDRVTLSGAGRARQMNTGALNARGKYVLFLHADTRLPGDFASLLLTAIASEELWGYFAIKLSGRAGLLRLIETTINWRSKVSGIATGDQCLWIERNFFTRQGGFADIPLMEDVELCRRLKKVKGPHRINDPVITSSRRWEQQGIWRTVLLMWWLRLCYFFGVSPRRLVRLYYPDYTWREQPDFRFGDSELVQFAKTMQRGKVKTRLQAVIGQSGSLQLHRDLVRCCFTLLQQSKLAPVSVELAGEQTSPQLNFFAQLAVGCQVMAQQGDNLGERMFNAIRQRLPLRKAVIIVGSDCPFFTDDYLLEALQKLDSGVDCVLGPAVDGGYVLIGLRRVDPALFEGVQWGSGQVLEQTIERLERLQWRYQLLPELADIDRPEDLALLKNSPLHAFDPKSYYSRLASV